MQKRKIGLALGSGAARGLAHIGVLDVLQKEGIPIDMVSGTSAGALIGALFAQSKDPEWIKSLALDLNAPKLVSLFNPTIPKSGFITGRNIKRLLSSYFQGDVKIDKMKLPFACIATDIETGEEIVFDHGSVLDAIRASISIPGIFSVVRWKGRHLVDGALVNPIPVDALSRMGADFIIAVNVIPEVSKETVQFATPHRDILKEVVFVNQVSSLVERLVIDGTDKLTRSRIVREVSSTVQKLTEQGSESIRNPKFVRSVSTEVKRLTKKRTDTLGKSKIVQGVSGRIQQLTSAQKAIMKEPNIMTVLLQSYNITAYSLAQANMRLADVVISPQVGNISLGDFLQGRECIEQGKIAASAVIPEIKRLLNIH